MTNLTLALDSLDGLSVGDALGSQFFVPGTSVADLRDGRVPDGPWPWTDDTDMACSVVAELRERGRIDPDRLATAFAERFDPYRGYGAGAVTILRGIREGVPWRDAAGAAFGGQGSMGNGAAMRVAPLGAFYAGDSRGAALDAMRSAEVTHANPEAVLGAVAVAVAAAEAGWARLVRHRLEPSRLLDTVLAYLIDSEVKTQLKRAWGLLGVSTAEAAYELGNGSRVLAQDTVPFALWVAATHLDDYPSAILACVEAGGDVDTTAAIAGGVVASYTGAESPSSVPKGSESEGAGSRGVPALWMDRREPLPAFALGPADPAEGTQKSPGAG